MWLWRKQKCPTGHCDTDPEINYNQAENIGWRKQKCPTGHCDHVTTNVMQSSSIVTVEKTKMPDRALRLLVPTHTAIQNVIHTVEKTKMPDRALRPLLLASVRITCQVVEKTKMPDRALRHVLEFGNRLNIKWVEKTKMPDRALRPATGVYSHSDPHHVEKTKMPDRALRLTWFPMIRRGWPLMRGENKNARQGIATIILSDPPIADVHDGWRKQKCPTGHCDPWIGVYSHSDPGGENKNARQGIATCTRPT